MLNLSDIPADKQEKAKYWLKTFEAWKKSELSKSKYCKLNKISDSTFYHWLKYLQGNAAVPYSINKKTQNKNNKSRFIAVDVSKEPSSKIANHNILGAGLSVTFSKGLSLKLEKDFDPATLLKVVKVLEALC